MSVSSPASATERQLRESTRGFGLSIALSTLLMATGVMAMTLAVETSIAVVILVAYMLMIGGVVQVVHAFRSKGIGPTIWKVVVALAYFITGLFLRMNLGIGLAALSLALVAFLTVEGIMNLAAFVRERGHGASIWLLLDGILVLLLAFMIWRHWPNRSPWMIGVLIGFTLLINGATRLMLTIAARRILKQAAENTV